jgi:hypothetical protein
LGEDSDELIKGVAAQICKLASFKEASAEKVDEAVAPKMTQLEDQLAIAGKKQPSHWRGWRTTQRPVDSC